MPVMIYDGDCGFCRKWVRRWSRLTGSRIVYAPYQRAAASFPQIPPVDFERAVQLVEEDGHVSHGALAVLRALAISGRAAWLLRLYRASPLFASAAEHLYRLVAEHRSGADRIDRWVAGLISAFAGQAPPRAHSAPGRARLRGSP